MLRERSEETKKLKNRIRYFECKNIFSSIKNMAYAVVKGEPLSLLAYGETGKRSSSDIDILVTKEDIINLEGVLRENGFEYSSGITREDRIFYISQSHQLMPYVKRTSLLNVTIDINFDIFWGGYIGKAANISEFLKDTEEVIIYGNYVKTLSPIKSLIHLCLHHYKELNSIYLLSIHNFYRRDVFMDVYMLIKNNLGLDDILQIVKICEELDIVAYAYFVLYYTYLLFPDLIIEKLLKQLFTPQGEKLIEHYGLEERRKWKLSFEERLHIDSVYESIKSDLTEEDIKKIKVNTHYFM